MSDMRPPSTDLSQLAHALFEESGDALVLVDPQSDAILDVNPVVTRLSGYERTDLLRLSASYLFRPEATGGSARLRRAAQHTNLHLHGFDGFFLRTKAGGWVPVSLTVTRLHVAPKPIGLITARDRTEQRALLESIRTGQEQLERVLEAVADGIVFVDKDAVIRLVNAAIERVMGRPRTELIGLRWADCRQQLRLPNGGEIPEREWVDLRVLKGGEAVTGVRRLVTRPDGSRSLIRGNAMPLRNERGHIVGMVASCTDITEQARAEEALAREHSLLRGLIDSLPDPITLKDKAGHYLGCNAAFEALAGKPERAMVGSTDRAVFGTDAGRANAAVEHVVLESGQPQVAEEWTEYPDGRKALFEIRRAPLIVPGGTVGGVIGVYRDVTLPRQLEEQLRQASKLEAVGRLAGGVAHDFNNLLTAVLGNLSLAQEMIGSTHPAIGLLAETEKAAWRAAELTRQLLGFARRTPLITAPTDLNAAVAETVALLRRTIDPRIEIIIQSGEGIGAVQADPGQIGQVLMNLCLNARDAMPDGGTLTLETAAVTVDEAYARSHVGARAGRFVRLRVSDTGTGIAPENVGRVFEPFFTTKGPSHGTGLGLAMVHGIVQQHNGWVECTTELGRGTTFDIYLASSEPAPSESKVATSEAASALAPATVLFVDDEPALRGVAQQILERQGYSVLTAEDGLSAIEVYVRERGRVALVVLDLTMPRLSGADALRRLVAIDPSVRVLVSSGYAAEQAPALGEPGVYGFLGKPYRPADLAAAVRAALE